MPVSNGLISGTAARALRNYMARISRLHEERKALSDDVAAVYAEAKASGFCIKTMKVAYRKLEKDPVTRATDDEKLDRYMAILQGDEPEADPEADPEPPAAPVTVSISSATTAETAAIPAAAKIQADGKLVGSNGQMVGSIHMEATATGNTVVVKGLPPGTSPPRPPSDAPDEVAFLR